MIPDTPKGNPSVLFLGKRHDKHCQKAFEYLGTKTDNITAMFDSWEDLLPSDAAADVLAWEGDIIISYLCRWIVKPEIIDRATNCAINFHPASPDYPGIGCNNFALYDNNPTYGATCHHLHAKVDTGPLIDTRLFPTRPNDTVASLLGRAYDEMLEMYTSIIDLIFAGEPLPTSDLNWTRHPYTRVDLNELMTLTPDMSEEELARRIRATSFAPWQPTMVVGDHRFLYVPPENDEDR